MEGAACEFCCVVQDTSRAHLVHETSFLLVFLDRLPLTRFHTLVIPKRHVASVACLAEHEASEIGRILPLIARCVTAVAQTEAYNIISNNGARAGQTVDHVHFHVIPRANHLLWNSNAMFGKGQRQELDDDEGLSMAVQMQKWISTCTHRTKL